MDRKLKIGILLNNDDVGVVYYVQNLIKTLNLLKEDLKPQISIFYTTYTQKHLHLFENYPNLETNIIPRVSIINFYLKSLFFNQNPYSNLAKIHKLDGFFPVLDLPVRIISQTKWIAWVTDFQHKYYPENFGLLNRLLREFRFKWVLKNADSIVLSSKTAANDLLKFYPKFNGNIKVLNFVSNANTSLNNLGELLEKYKIQKPYFMISNQFYKHKNHKVVFESIQLLDLDTHEFIFTGKTEDYRDPKFYPELMLFVNSLGISHKFKILGMIPRDEQLLLMKNAEAVIQPSLFEGWNTSIEDAKNIIVPIICSEINVHKEQMQSYGYYFEPNIAQSLVETINNFILDKQNHNVKLYPFDTPKRMEFFGCEFLKIFK